MDLQSTERGTDTSYQNKKYNSREEVPKRTEKPRDAWKGTQNKTKNTEKSSFEFNCPHLQTNKWSREQAKVSFLLHELLDNQDNKVCNSS